MGTESILRDEQSVAEANSGVRPIAEAAWWGFDPQDSTHAIQAAIQSKARAVRVANLGKPWIVRPLMLRSDLELIFEPGVVVLARAGEFLGGGDCLFRAQDVTNVTVRGHGAVLRMRKSDYQRAPYPKAEWRMGLAFYGCSNIRIEGVRIESTGGDGIYIGSSAGNRWCRNVEIRDVVCHDNHRQGISVISAMDLLVENCVFSGTSGTPPEAGIDLEPDSPDERLVRCVFRNCRTENNRGNGILIYLKPLEAPSEPVSIRFEDCSSRMGTPGDSPEKLSHLENEGASGIAVGWTREKGPKGHIEFLRCSTENSGRESVRITDKASDGPRVRFVDCGWTNSWVARHRTFGGVRAPILMESKELEFCSRAGGVDWLNCVVDDRMEGPVLRLADDSQRVHVTDLQGRILVRNPKPPTIQLGREASHIGLAVEAAPIPR